MKAREALDQVTHVERAAVERILARRPQRLDAELVASAFDRLYTFLVKRLHQEANGEKPR